MYVNRRPSDELTGDPPKLLPRARTLAVPPDGSIAFIISSLCEKRIGPERPGKVAFEAAGSRARERRPSTTEPRTAVSRDRMFTPT
jgi:hypothetical protein